MGALHIEFVGLDELKVEDSIIGSIKSSVQQEFEKIKAIIRQDANLKVHIKRHFASDEDKRHTYSVVLHLEYSGNYVSIDNVIGWDLDEAVKTAMKELETRVNKIFKTQGVQARDAEKTHAHK